MIMMLNIYLVQWFAVFYVGLEGVKWLWDEKSFGKPSKLWLGFCIAAGICVAAYFTCKEKSKADYVVFSNDGPYGACSAAEQAMPSYTMGCWMDSQFIGAPYMPPPPMNGGLRMLTMSNGLQLLVLAATIAIMAAAFMEEKAAYKVCDWLFGISCVFAVCSAIFLAIVVSQNPSPYDITLGTASALFAFSGLLFPFMMMYSISRHEP